MDFIRINALCIFSWNGNSFLGKGIDKKSGEVFFRPFGGGIKFSEKSEETIIREIKEEIGATAINLKKLTVFENIFEYNGEKKHEITFLYQADFLEKAFYEDKKFPRIDKDGHAEWVSINDILSGKLILYPKQILDYL